MSNLATRALFDRPPRRGRNPRQDLFVGALCSVVLALALVSTGPAPLAEAAPCTPAASAKGEFAGGVYFYTMNLNRCAYTRLADKYGDQSGYLGVAGLVAGWVPGAVGKAAGSILGVLSMRDFFTQGKLKSCTRSFTSSGATLVFAKGTMISCKPTFGGGGGM